MTSAAPEKQPQAWRSSPGRSNCVRRQASAAQIHHATGAQGTDDLVHSLAPCAYQLCQLGLGDVQRVAAHVVDELHQAQAQLLLERVEALAGVMEFLGGDMSLATFYVR